MNCGRGMAQVMGSGEGTRQREDMLGVFRDRTRKANGD